MYLKTELTNEMRDSMRISLSVQPKKIASEPVCDFCGDPHPVVVYRASKMSTGQLTPCWRWCACEACEEAVDRDDWKYIRKKVEARLLVVFGHMMPTKPPKSLVSEAVRKSLDQFHEAAITV